mgnify:CR=1 FL=1
MQPDSDAFVRALQDIHAIMDGKEWSADTLEAIAHVLESVGLPVREPDHELTK